MWKGCTYESNEEWLPKNGTEEQGGGAKENRLVHYIHSFTMYPRTLVVTDAIDHSSY